jgi:uncharacterized SAM-binding protein YcdF (DUF218 family)
MFFALSKTLSYLAMPVVITALFLLAGLISRNACWSKRFRLTGTLLFFLFSNDFIANEVMGWWEIPATPFDSLRQTYTYGVLLTGVTSTDRHPDDRVYFNRGADRVFHTAELYKRGIIRHIIVSGGSGRLIAEGRKEARDVYKALLIMGIPPEHITVESASRNTYESAQAVGAMLRETGGKALLITSAFHMRRARACFRKAGCDLPVFSTDFYTHPRYWLPDSFLIPSHEAWIIWHKLFKEWTGMVAYRVAGYL